MIMKKNFILAAMAAMFSMGFTACNNNEAEGNFAEDHSFDEIGWDVTAEKSVSTRGEAVTASNARAKVTSFMTWGYNDATNALYLGESATEGRTVTNTGTADSPVWTYTPKQFWPTSAPLNFVAITPASDASITSISTAPASNIATLTANVTLDTDVENQKDIMMAHADGITKATNASVVPFTFNHALSQIVFKGKIPTGGAITKVTIAEISICNVNKTAALTFNSEGNFYGGTALSPVLKPASSSTPATFTLEASDLEASVWTVGDNATAGTAFDLTISNNATKKNAWFMIPQTTSAWTGPAAINATPASGAYLKIRAQLEKDGVVLLGNAAADALYIPLSVDWERGKKYIYTLEFNGDSALSPISFDMTVSNWTDAAAQEIEF